MAKEQENRNNHMEPLNQAAETQAQNQKSGSEGGKETAPAKKKLHFIFHPEHSTKGFPQKQKPEKKKAETNKTESSKTELMKTEASKTETKKQGAASHETAAGSVRSEETMTRKPAAEKPQSETVKTAAEKERKEDKQAGVPEAKEQKNVSEAKASKGNGETEQVMKEEKKMETGKAAEEKAVSQTVEQKAATDNRKEEPQEGSQKKDGQMTSQRRDGQNPSGQKRDGQSNQGSGQRRDGQGSQGSYQRREGQGSYQRRDGQGSQGSYQRREGQGSQNGQGSYQRRDSQGGQGSYQRREGQGSQNGQGSYQRRDGQGSQNGQGSYQRREGQGSQGSYQRRDGQGTQGGQGSYQRRDGQGGQGTYQRRDGQGAQSGQGTYQRRDGQGGQGSYQRRDGQGGQGSYQRRDGQGGQGTYQRRDGQGGQGSYQRRDGQGSQGSYQRRDGQGGQGSFQHRDGRGGSRFGSSTSESITPALSKSEVRGGKNTNKKEREQREKSKQYADKTGRFQENTKNISKLKGAFHKPEAVPVKEDDGIRTLTIPEIITIKELAERMKQAPAALVKSLFLKGNMVTINSEITYEQAEEIALDYNFICEQEVKVNVIEELLKEEDDAEELKVSRPPVVCVMGHVDHGKTSLLDAIRSTNVIAKEAGGITQHIGAYTVKCNGQDITFLDTPGHEAFTAMRMRGAQATDIAILVVAADDGVMPQTIEAINHAKAAGVEIIVAVNKIDKPSANVERVMQEMSEYELVPEAWGGETIFVPVSAKSHAGIDTLLEMVLLVAEVKELKANPNRRARGLVIEAQLDKGRGPVATVLVQKGTLHVGDTVAAGSCYGKVRAMIDDKGRRLKEAYPSTPVEILGLNEVPNAGEVFVATENEREARSFAETFIKESREKLLADTKAKLTLEGLNSQIKEGSLKELNIIVKADVQGSVEAVKQSLLKLSNDEVVVKIIHGGVGAINESDVTLASASNAIVIGFNVRPDAMAKTLSEREKVEVRLYRVIYQAIADVEAAMKGMLDPIFEEKILGHAVVRQIFKASGVGNIAGSYVTDGIFQRGCQIRIRRGEELIYEGALASLKRFKDDVKEVKEGYECGLVFDKFNDILEEDVIESYTMVEVPR